MRMIVQIAVLFLLAGSSERDGASGPSESGPQQAQETVDYLLDLPAAERVRMLDMVVQHELLPVSRRLEVATLVRGDRDVASVPLLRIESDLAVALAARASGQPAQARESAVKALSGAQEISDLSLELRAHFLLATFDQQDGNTTNAVNRLLEFHETHRDSGDLHTEALCLSKLGQLAWQSKCSAASIDLYRRARTKYLSLEDTRKAADITRQISLQLESTGDIPSAKSNAEEAVMLAERSGDPSTLFLTKSQQISLLRYSEVDRQSAVLGLESLLANAAAGVSLQDKADAHLRLADVYVRAGNVAAAIRHVEIGMKAPKSGGGLGVLSLIACAKALHSDGQAELALKQLNGLLADLNGQQNEVHALIHEVSAGILSDLGRSEEANASLYKALELMKSATVKGSLARAGFMEGWSAYQRKETDKIAALKAQRAERTTQLYSAIATGLGCVFLVFWICRSTARRRLDAVTKDSLEKLKQDLDVNTLALREEMESRQKLELELERNGKAEAIAALTSGVAHDFNNLMTVVISSNELIRITSADKLGDRELIMLDESTHAAKSGAEITSQLLALARRRPTEKRLMRVAEFLNEIRGLLQRTVGETVTLRLECLDQSACVYSDRTQLTTALINLCCNARDAVERRGEIVVRADRPYGTGSADPVVISVIDEGAGMTREQIGMACKPLYTTKGETEGTGLGLSVVEQFVRDSGGALTIASRLGEGTTVSMKLPSSEYEPDADEREHQLKKLDGVSVIVVDDKSSVLQSVERTLKMLGCEVQAVTSADEAQVSIDENGPPDVLLSDVRMPGMLDGLDLAEWVKRHHAHLPVVLMTGYSDSPTGEFPVLPKPFTMRELSLVLSSVIQSEA